MSLEVVDKMDMMRRESISLVTGLKPRDNPEAPDISEVLNIGVVYYKHNGNKYEIVFILDRDNLGSDSNISIVPLSCGRCKCVYYQVLCIVAIFTPVTKLILQSYLNKIQYYYIVYKIEQNVITTAKI